MNPLDQFSAEQLQEIGAAVVNAPAVDQIAVVRVADHRRAIGVYSPSQRHAAIYPDKTKSTSLQSLAF